MSNDTEQTSAIVSPAAVMAHFRPLVVATGKNVTWWWLLVSLLPVVAVLVAYAGGALWFYGKSGNEAIAVPILAVAAAAWLGRAVRERSGFMALVSLQVVIFLMREIHFKGTGLGVYVATAGVGLLVLCMAWRVDWRQAVATVDWAMVTALLTTGACYAVALLVQRRVFRIIPGEEQLHVPLEEVGESAAHLCFLVSAFVRTRKTSAPDA
jgi:hypothetical protein